MAMTSPGTATALRQGESSTWLITIDGEHDIATRSLLEQAMSTVGPACRTVVVDLSAASFVDASVINWLAQLQEIEPTAEARVLRVVVGAAAGAAGRLFDVLQLGEMFACFPSTAAATG
jgi:anti-anti-sigma regulatory factor